ncbi:MAG: hypothetical protein ACREEO_01850, partial [Phenylobacterium sp.]
MALENERIDEAERLRPFFAVQLQFAERLATLGGPPFPEAVLRYTNLHRRFGLGRADPDRPRSEWLRIEAQLVQRQGLQERLDAIVSCYADAKPQADLTPRFGCFRFDPPGSDGVVRIHFSSRDADDVSPLARDRAERRRAELAEMCAYIGRHHPDAKTVQGGSWLYNLEAYCRLFPPAYVASRRTPTQVRLDGTSTWGQLLTYRGELKTAVRDQLVGRLGEIELTAPWRVFPLQALGVQAPFRVFQDHFAGLRRAGRD